MTAADRPLIVQSDRTLLLEADHPLAAECRAAIAGFAELERSPEHVHTYRITPLSLWNARAAGMTTQEMLGALERFSRYSVPGSVRAEIADQAARYGRLRIEPGDGALLLRTDDPAILEEVTRVRQVGVLLGTRVDATSARVDPLARGRLKQALIKAGWPAEDLAGYAPGAPLDVELRNVTRDGEPFALRDYQRDAVESFWAAGRRDGGSGVLVLPCGAGKTLIGIGVMERARTRTLILATSVVAVRQWRAELLRRTDLGEDEIGEYSGAEKSPRAVTIATYQVLTHRVSRRGAATDAEDGARGGGLDEYPHLALLGRQDWGLVIYDEVHLLPAPVFRMTAEIQSKRRLGLTATLVREDGREDDVFSLIGPKRYDAPWRALEAEGWIAPAVCEEVRLGMSAQERMAYATAEPQERYRIAATVPRKLALTRALCARHRSDRVLVIGQYLDQLEELATALDAPLITGATQVRERERLYARFRTGDLRLLVVSKVANFSIDLPEANVAIQVSGSFGSRQEEAQRLGRILRPKQDGGQARFYTLVTRETKDQDFAMHRQLFLAEQGYRYEIRDAGEVLAE
ncbi:MAG TPA: DNA repair helicase XPB [Candidatus Limnocylindria bacterium]|nr:DNA repair helicase XPB [Candidatus Limnocylindria bacterium]